MTSIVVFSVLSVAIGYVSRHQPRLLLGIGGGLSLGVLLGWIGLRLTQFETTADGHFYIPNTPFGVALSLLLVGRLAYRFRVLRDAATASYHAPPMQSPLTFFIIGLTAGYYIVYQTGLFLHSRDQKGFELGGSKSAGSPLDSARDRS
ncbi:MAG: DUF1453 domain-containing protein [Verrucomicrobiia bacterium]